MKDKKVLIIGGSGYIGTVITKNFLKKNIKVVNLDNHLFGNAFAIEEFKKNKNYSFFFGDLHNANILTKASYDVTDVIILASIVGDPLSKKYPEITQYINETGVKNCIKFFNNRNIDKLIFASTCSNYGLIEKDLLADENYKLNPLSLYAKTKVNVENYILDKSNNFDFSTIILRFSTAFGLSNRMRFDLTVNQFTLELLLGNELVVYDPDTWRPYFHTEDFAEVAFRIINLNKKFDKEVFNVGDDKNNLTKRNLVNLIRKYLPKSKIKIQENGLDKRNYKVNFNKIKSLLKFEARGIEKGIVEIIKEFESGKFYDYQSNFKKYINDEIKYEKKTFN